MLKIIVGGRFDYMKAAWSRMADDRRIIYFENDILHDFDLKTRIKNRVFQIADRCGFIKQEKREEHERINNLLELFDINSLYPQDTLLFILYEMNVLSTDFSNIHLIKKKFPKSKFVLFFSNVIGTVRPKETKQLLDNRNSFDLIYTFSPNDALKYDLRLFYGGAFPCDPCTINRDEKYKSDIFWIGKNKGRYDYLVDISRKLKRNGVNAKFLITQENGDYDTSDVEVISEYLSYTEYLKYLYNI